MASTELRGDSYRSIFRYGRRKFSRSLTTRNFSEAEAVWVEENVKLLERGRLELPPGADLVAFLLFDGKLGARPEAVSRLTLGRLLDLYVQTLTEGAESATTLATQRTHVKHLKAVLKASPPSSASPRRTSRLTTTRAPGRSGPPRSSRRGRRSLSSGAGASIAGTWGRPPRPSS